MQYLVTMTTRVPHGTDESEVGRVRAAEAVRSRELAAEHALLRLWRPPLQPGEWRSLGLFEAIDRDRLEQVLASMPLRVWRTDDVEELAPHPNDPAVVTPCGPDRREFLTRFAVAVPADVGEEEVARTNALEAIRIRELAAQGSVARLWMVAPSPGVWRALGLWCAADERELQSTLRSLPMDGWMSVRTTPLVAHPSDPGRL